MVVALGLDPGAVKGGETRQKRWSAFLSLEHLGEGSSASCIITPLSGFFSQFLPCHSLSLFFDATVVFIIRHRLPQDISLNAFSPWSLLR